VRRCMESALPAHWEKLYVPHAPCCSTEPQLMSRRTTLKAAATMSNSDVCPDHSFAWNETPQASPARLVALPMRAGYGIVAGVGGANFEQSGYGFGCPAFPYDNLWVGEATIGVGIYTSGF
jgi:hypothetical protein